jgi:hypothetical protein
MKGIKVKKKAKQRSERQREKKKKRGCGYLEIDKVKENGCENESVDPRAKFEGEEAIVSQRIVFLRVICGRVVM